MGRAGGSWACDGRLCGGWVKVEASKAPSTPRVKIQKASRLGAQSVTAKSKLLALNCAIMHTARGTAFEVGSVRRAGTLPNTGATDHLYSANKHY